MEVQYSYNKDLFTTLHVIEYRYLGFITVKMNLDSPTWVMDQMFIIQYCISLYKIPE